MKIACPDATQWDLFLADMLAAEAELTFDEHLKYCENCKAQLERITNPATIQHIARYLESFPKRSDFTNRMESALLNAMHSDSADDPAKEQPPPVISGYQLHEIIGQGGSSVVYRASDTKLQRTVAIKLLRENSSSVQRQRFVKEAKSLASLHHFNVGKIIEAGESSQYIYLVLEFISGGSLANYLAGSAQPPHETVRVIQQLASAIQKAHDTGFIHRDLKPGNILLDPHFGTSETFGLDRYVPKIIDFGIVKELQACEDFTKTRDFVGTPSYMAPEQISHSKQPVDQRTDVYALGIILYEMLTGRPPFRASSPIDTMLQIKHEEPIPPSRFEPKLPRDLENICLKCIEKVQDRRYASAQLLSDDLSRFLAGKPVLARPLSIPSRVWRWCKRNPGWTIAAMFVFMILTALAIAGPLLAHRERLLREEAAFEKTHAQEHLDLAGKALDEMLDRLLNNMRLQDSTFDDIQKGMVSFAIPYLEQFAHQADSVDMLQLRRARSLIQLAMVQVKTNERDKAQNSYESAISLLNSLESSTIIPRESLLRSLSSAHLEYGRFLNIHRNDNVHAEKHYRNSLDYAKELDHGVINEKNWDKYAILYSLLGEICSKDTHRHQEGLEFLKSSNEYRDQLVKLHPERDDMRHYAAMAHMNLSNYHFQHHDRDAQIKELRLAIELEQQVNRSKSIWIESPYYISHLEGNLAIALELSGNHEEAMPLLKKARQLADALSEVYPSIDKYSELRKHWQAAMDYYDK